MTSEHLRQHLASMIETLDTAFPDSLIVESPDQDVRDIYTETHFVLGCILLDLTGDGSMRRIPAAERRLRRWEGLRTETPFNNFANCVSLALLRSHGLFDQPLARLAHAICVRQTLDRVPPRAGNNILVMKALTDLVFRPLALGREPAATGWVEAARLLDGYLSPEGFYFDAPREGDGERHFPGAYCLKFLFLIGLVHLLTGNAGARARFVRGLQAVLPYFTQDGCFSYLGRSDNTTFADGLAIFCLRLGVAVDDENIGAYAGLLRAAEARFLATPVTPGGWPKVNRWHEDGGDPWARDAYAHPTEYATAAAAYILLGLLAMPEIPSIEPDPAGRDAPCISHDLGVARLAVRKMEAFVRTQGQTEAASRRYLGPTILRATLSHRLLIGAIPIRVGGETAPASTGSGLGMRHVGRLFHLWGRGSLDLDPTTVGFLPFLIRSGERCVPAAGTVAALAADHIVTNYSMRRVRFRGTGVVVNEIRMLLRKNLRPSAAALAAPSPPVEDGARLVRSVALAGDALVIEDRVENAETWTELRIAMRLLTGTRATVHGMRPLGRTRGWSSDGPVELQIYARPVAASPLACRIEVRFDY